MHWSKLCRLVSYFEEEPHWKGSAQSTTVSSNCIREIGNKVLIPRFLAAKNLGLWDSWDFNGDLTRIKVRKSLIFSSWLLTHSLRFHPYSFCFSTAIALFFILRGHLSYLIEDLTFDTCTQLFYIFDTVPVSRFGLFPFYAISNVDRSDAVGYVRPSFQL